MSTYTDTTRSSIDLSATSVSRVVLMGLAVVAFCTEGALWFANKAHGCFFGLGLKKHGLRK